MLYDYRVKALALGQVVLWVFENADGDENDDDDEIINSQVSSYAQYACILLEHMRIYLIF